METTVNERIKMLRNHFNLSQGDFATKVDGSYTSISRIENGLTEPRGKTLMKIIENTGISREWLLHGKGDMIFTQSVRVDEEEKKASWSEKAFDSIKKQNEHLEQEIQFLRDMLKNITSKLGTANFNNGFDIATLLETRKCVETVRVAA